MPKTIGLFCPPHPFRKTGDNLSCFKRPVRHKNRPQKNRSCRVLNYIKLRDDNWGTIVFGGGPEGLPGGGGRTKTDAYQNLEFRGAPLAGLVGLVGRIWSTPGARAASKKNKDVEPFNLGLCPNLFLKRCSEGAY